ncbi:MAG: MBL fold metallo-hydrolase [Candidatus Sericytochromatia bacterium]
MIFRQMFDAESSTYTYLIGDEQSREAALIDSVQEQAERDTKVLKELGLTLKYLLETHVHADHITGVTRLKAQFAEAKSVVSAQGGAPCADHLAQDGDLFRLGELEIRVLATPGHTNGCISYQVGDRVFTGDALLIRGCGRTDFQEGSASQLYDSVTQKLFALPDQTQVYPGHNYIGLTSSTIGEEKQHNPRLGGGKSKAEFVDIMDNLKLAQPAKIMEAVPANLKCGNLSEVSPA